MNINSIVFIAVAYLLGSVSFAVVVSKLMRLKDPRSYGSKNPGATNVLRSGNKIAALITLLGDTFKGWLIIFLSLHYFTAWNLTPVTPALAGIAVVLGHLFPLFFHFKGGKGVATAVGVIFAFSWQVGLIMLGIWLLIFFMSKISSLSALIIFMLCPFLSLIFINDAADKIGLTFISILIIWRHQENIHKLRRHQENKIGGK